MIRLFLRIQQNTCSSAIEKINFFDKSHWEVELALIKKYLGESKPLIVTDDESSSHLKGITDTSILMHVVDLSALNPDDNICFFLSKQESIKKITQSAMAAQIHILRHEGDFTIDGEAVDCDCASCLMVCVLNNETAYALTGVSKVHYQDGNQYTLLSYAKKPVYVPESKQLKSLPCKLKLDKVGSPSFFTNPIRLFYPSDTAPNKIHDHAYHSFSKIGRPVYFSAPMIGQSELAFRMLLREQAGVQICYTPMAISALFLSSESYRDELFSTCGKDRPLVVQFAANNPSELLAAAKMVEGRCDAIDINLGCPQPTGRRHFYGAWLMEDWDLIYKMVSTLKKNLTIPVWCKIRIYESLPKTLAYAKMIEAAGCSLLTVHGRLRRCAMNDQPANWEFIREIKKALHIPVIANGSIDSLSAAKACLALTGCDGVMAASSILSNPLLFLEQQKATPKQVALLYLEYARKYKALLRYAIPHVLQILGNQLTPEAEDAIKKSKSIEEMERILIPLQLLQQKVTVKSAFDTLFDSQSTAPGLRSKL